MSSSASRPPNRRQWRWWIPDYPERLDLRDVVHIASTVLLTVLFAIATIGYWGSGGLTWLFALASALGAFGLVGIGVGLRRSRRRAGS